MASQSSYEFPPEWGLVPPNPDPDLVLPGDAIEKELDRIEMPSHDVPISRIIGSTPLAFRPDVEIPELSEIDSETDEQPGTPPDAGASFAGWNRTVESDSPPVQRVTVIGGAVVRNLCLVIPDEDMNGFADLPVQPIRASKGQPAQLVAKILDDETEKPPMPFLLLPDERRGGSDIKSADSTAMNLSKMDEFVLSGDIDDFWGIKGLTAKLYKYQGPEKDVVDVPEEPEDKKDKSQDDTEEPSGKMVPLSTEPDTKPSDDKDDKDIKEEDSEEHDKDEPAREKIKLNTESFSLKGQPLGTLFPSINDFNLKNLPVENLEFTYSEEKKNFLFKPGLRLEVDVLFTNNLAWAGDALRKLFGPTDPPKPKIENLVLQGFFPPLALKAWDLLNFRTLGIEITATKATKNKPSKEKPEGDKHEDGKTKGENDGDHDTGSGENETTKLSKFRATEQSPDDGGGENEEGEDDEEGSDDKAKEKKSWFFGFAFFGTVLVTKVPHANVPLDMNYRIARDFSIKTMDASPKDDDKKSGENDQKGKETDKKEDESKHKRSWNLLIKPDKWENIYGIENVTMKDAELKASFEEGDFRSTISRDDNFLEAEKIHAQISGQKLPEKETKKPDDEKKEDEKKTSGGNEIAFKGMKLKLSNKKSKEEKTTRKALELNGKATFNEHSSAVGSLTFASEGVTVQGGISDVKIPDTEITIKKAGLEIFFGFKSKKNEEKSDEKSGNDKKDSKPTGESKPEVLGKDQDGEVAEKSLVKSSDKSSAKTPSEKKEKDHKTKKVKRGSRFGILGVVEINKVAIKVGLYTEKREWLAFGAIENEEEKEPDNWDVLGTVDAYNYPVVKGLQLCSTIPSFPQLEELNGKKKLEGLTLVSSITSNGKISATIDHPESFKLRYYYRHQVVYGARVEHPRNITFQSKLYLFHHGIPQEKLRYNVFNGRTWEGDTDIHIDDVTVGFTAVVFNDKIYLFYLPRYGFSSHRYAYVAFDGRRWEKAHTLARYATSGVTAAVYQNKLYLMHRGYGETNVKKLWYNAFDGKRWITLSKKTGAMLIPDCDDIEGDICSVVYEDKMYVFYKKLSNSGVYRNVFDGNKWAAEQVEGVQTAKGVASVVH
ncbi:Kelch-type beta propeller [Fusarium oxysporum f. sp. vasinfectum]|nr:Kelch-type beta propeller [Fusarium oxysporum f. sp. vasinfectum]